MAGTLTVDEALQRRIIADAIRYTLTRLAAVFLPVMAGLILLVVLMGSAFLGGTLLHRPWIFMVPFLTASFIGSGMLVLQIRRQVRQSMPVGSEVSSSVIDGIWSSANATTRVETAVDALQRARIAGETVIVQLRGAPVLYYVPRQLLADEELAALGAR